MQSTKPPTIDISQMTELDVRALATRLLGELAEATQIIQDLKDEIARLKGVKGRPNVKPSGMNNKAGSGKEGEGNNRSQRRRGPKNNHDESSNSNVVKEEQTIKAVHVPEGSRFKGYEDFVVQDLIIQAKITVYHRERWQTPEGITIVSLLPEGITGHFGPDLQRFILSEYYRGQVTMPKITAILDDIGIEISKRQVVRLLNQGKELFLDEDRAVLQAGLENGRWITVDDTGGRHKAENQYTVHMGNDLFDHFATCKHKSRINFLELLQMEERGYCINAEAVSYMVEYHIPKAVIDCLMNHGEEEFTDFDRWNTHLKSCGISLEMRNGKNIVRIVTEAALIGYIEQQGLLAEKTIISDGAGQFNVFLHARCWIHAERSIHTIVTVTPEQQQTIEATKALIWDYYRTLDQYKKNPQESMKKGLRNRFDLIFMRKTGFEKLDAAMARLYFRKEELLMVLNRPEIPLHTNGSENSIRCHVTKRKISGGTRSDLGRDCRDAFLGLMKTCAKHAIAFWDYLGSRLHVPNAPAIPPLCELIRMKAVVVTR